MKKLLFFGAIILGINTHSQETHNITWFLGITESEASLTIDQGDTVLWTWGDNMQHSITSTDPDAPSDFGSEVMSGEGQTYQYTFTAEADIDYHCSVHPATMIGNIHVNDDMSVEDKFLLNLKYYPSVVTDELSITSLIPIEKYEIIDLQGKKILMDENLLENVLKINLSHLPSGVYFVNLQSKSQIKTSFKILKK